MSAMGTFDWVAVFASCAFVVAVSYYANRPSSADDQSDADDRSAWQDSTGSDPQTVADDVAEARKKREIAELEAWLRAPSRPRNAIPHQTRRTEEDQ
ncbi:hypothetical protein [Streptomyces virginiae]|uniref:hypothetical protein n=1 Tax=Streptomyces virginiae TaxID=1961 RepID=UPI002258AF93|nr:hypothetical protein [Streptomyces virginiae]MCX5176764.1 hypothetical protein [Streptomyces virginiae]